MNTTPTIGRIVDYTYPTGEVVAALITLAVPREGVEVYEENDYVVSLKAFPPKGVDDIPEAPHTDAKPGSDEAFGKWSWPSLVRGSGSLGGRRSDARLAAEVKPEAKPEATPEPETQPDPAPEVPPVDPELEEGHSKKRHHKRSE